MKTTGLFLMSALLTGCAGGATNKEPPSKAPVGKGDQISPSDDPNQLISGASFKLSDNINASDVGQTFGTDDGHIPYPDTYWPFVEEGSDAHWNDGSDSPVEKFMKQVDASKL